MPSQADLCVVVRRLERAGFDAVAVFEAQRFNHTTNEADFRLPEFGRKRTLALVIGNSRELWDPFIRALDDDPALADAAHPLDQYTRVQVAELRAALDVRSEAFFAHQSHVPIQRIAWAGGLAELSPSHLSVHAVHGPWLGLRAVVVFDCEPPPAAERSGERMRRHCEGCSAPCVAALERALANEPSADEEARWRAWLAVREACPVAPGRRYGPNQLRYHYTKDKRALVPEPA